MIPWASGRCLAWDATAASTLAPAHLPTTPPLLARPLNMLPDRNIPSTLSFQSLILLNRSAMMVANFCGR